MSGSFQKNLHENCIALLPFKSKRPVLPDNYEQALQRAKKLRTNLRMNPDKEKQFCAFMEKIFEKGHAEPAAPLKAYEERWYLPIFGVFHPKKYKIRVVFDSSAKFLGVSLNDVLMTGPDLTNSLIGVLLKFRKDREAITADIEQMFFNFYVHEEDRNFLRFLWFKDNNIDNELVEFRMCVHVFGNSPSPAVATFRLRKSACDHQSPEFCNEVCELVNKQFYVDDALVSLPDANDSWRPDGSQESHEQDWDDPLPDDLHAEWEKWRRSLFSLESLRIPRMFVDIQNVTRSELHTFCDASQDDIGAVTYVKLYNVHGQSNYGFVMGKSKLAPHHSSTIPRLELCAAVLGVEIGGFVADHLNIPTEACYFYTDSRVVLGYIYNESRRFHVYVANRVDRIRRATFPSQWNFIATDCNPADQCQGQDFFSLVNPDEDKELKLNALKTTVSKKEGIGSERFTRFSSWPKLVTAIANLNKMAIKYKKESTTKNPLTFYKEAEQFILRTIQQECYYSGINCLRSGKAIPGSSPIVSLSPVLDGEGILRVGGRLGRANLPTGEKTPVLVPGEHHIAKLLVVYHHGSIYQQRRHLTERSIRRVIGLQAESVSHLPSFTAAYNAKKSEAGQNTRKCQISRHSASHQAHHLVMSELMYSVHGPL
ncbi:uncharacterized protein LOC128160994 [Crassostrea angulata]|uniref:uncharacterized protein LOC128160994 n=1 Tax=Magallana angulata TaxID=2784310 RepID=UPI0022B19752|nr:uncharacterized protein LOC128160994 [Crassostrea angulata]